MFWRSTSSLYRGQWGVAVLALVSACDSPFDLVEPRVSGAHVEVYVHGEGQVCAGTVADIDARIEAVRSYLGLTGSLKTPVRYHWYPSPEAMVAAAHCEWDGVVNQCFRSKENRIFAYELPHAHELVHAATADLGQSELAYMEGLATYLGLHAWQDDAGIDIEGSFSSMVGIDGTAFGYDEYMLAGRYIGHLAEHEGPGVVAELIESTPTGKSHARVEREFIDIVGYDFAALSDALAGDRLCGRGDWRNPVYECSLPARPWLSPDLWQWTAGLDCSEPGVIGAEPGVRVRYTVLEIPEAGTFRVSAAGAGLWVNLRACGGCGTTNFGFLNPENPREIELEAGSYLVTMSSRVPGALGLRGVRVARMQGR